MRIAYGLIPIALFSLAIDAAAQDAGIPDAAPADASALASDAGAPIAEPEPFAEPEPLDEPDEPDEEELAVDEDLDEDEQADEDESEGSFEDELEEESLIETISEELDLHVHGFASQGFILSLGNNYLADSTDGSFEMAEAALNVTSQPLDDLRIGIQLFARDLGPLGNYDIKLDWFYVDYRFADWIGIRAGRTKIPFGLYNEVQDVDVARVPVLLPQSTYPTANRDYLLAQTGVELYSRIPMGEGGTLDLRVYGGTVFLEAPATHRDSPIEITNVAIPFLVGGRLLWETPIEGLRVGGSVQAVKLDIDFLDMMNASHELGGTVALWTSSIEYVHQDLLLAAEYGQWITDAHSNDPMYPANDITSDRGYVMGSYRVAPWFAPGLYYSLYFPNVDDRHGRANRQNDVALTLRFDINQYWLVKVEGHFMEGVADVTTALNPGVPRSELDREWGVLFLKTTGYF